MAADIAKLAADSTPLSVNVTMASGAGSMLNKPFTLEISKNGAAVQKLDNGVKVSVSVSANQTDMKWVVAVQNGTEIIRGSYDAASGQYSFNTDSAGNFTLKPAILIDLAIASDTFTRNGAENSLDVVPVIKNDRTLVPVRFIAEALGADVNWDGGTQTVTISMDGKTMPLVIGELAPGLDVPAEIIGDRTMVPLRYISEQFGARVDYEASSQQISITKMLDVQ